MILEDGYELQIDNNAEEDKRDVHVTDNVGVFSLRYGQNS